MRLMTQSDIVKLAGTVAPQRFGDTALAVPGTRSVTLQEQVITGVGQVLDAAEDLKKAAEVASLFFGLGPAPDDEYVALGSVQATIFDIRCYSDRFEVELELADGEVLVFRVHGPGREEGLALIGLLRAWSIEECFDKEVEVLFTHLVSDVDQVFDAAEVKDKRVVAIRNLALDPELIITNREDVS